MKKIFLLGFLAISVVALAQQVTPVTVQIAELKIDSLRQCIFRSLLCIVRH